MKVSTEHDEHRCGQKMFVLAMAVDGDDVRPGAGGQRHVPEAKHVGREHEPKLDVAADNIEMLEASFFHPELDRRAARRLLGREPPRMVNGERCIRPAPEAVARGPWARQRREGRASRGAASAAWGGLLTSLLVGGMFSE